MTRFRRLAALLVLAAAALATIATSPPYEEDDFWVVEDRVELEGVIMNSATLLASWEYRVLLEPGDDSVFGSGEMDIALLTTIDGATEETEIRVTVEHAPELLLPLEDHYELLAEQSHELAFGAQSPYFRNTMVAVPSCSFEEGSCAWYFRVQVELLRGGPVAIDPAVDLLFEGPGWERPVLEATVGEPVGFVPAT